MSASGSGLIPLFDLERQNRPLAAELMEAVSRVAESQQFILGAAVADFEAAVADYLNVADAVGLASGSDALYLALRALDLREGDEVVTSPFTFFATAGAIVNAGGRPVFADIDPRTFNLDPAAVAALVSDRTRAIVAVHLFGQMASMEPLLELARERELWVIEDAAQAIGAKALVDGRWQTAGAVGTIGCFSFYPTKNLAGWGDGGLIATNDAALADRIRRLRVHGAHDAQGIDLHREVGINSRLDAIQAALLQVKLRHLPGWTELRRARAAGYDEKLALVDAITTPPAEHDRFHVYNLYTVRAQRRDALRAHLTELGIGTGVYYPLPLHLQPCFASLGYREGDFPEAERASGEVLSLPLYPELTPRETERVATAIREFYAA